MRKIIDTFGYLSFDETSTKALEKIGFEKEGFQKKAIFRNSKHHDVLLFGLLREDWGKKC